MSRNTNQLQQQLELMATSAAQLATLLDAITKEYKLDSEEVLGFLADKELLPKKLLPKSVKAVNLFASKKAEEVALEYHFQPDGATGSGKDGKWTVKDVEKAVQKPVATKVLVSPTVSCLPTSTSWTSRPSREPVRTAAFS